MDASIQPNLDDALAALGAVLAEPARARMLCALMDGRAHTATELSLVAGISPSTASAHLSRLQDSVWIRCIPQGRHRYYALADDEIAALIETLLGAAQRRMPSIRSTTPEPLRHARTCYHHAAGAFAVDLHDRMMARAWLVPMAEGYALSDAGRAAFARLGLDADTLRARARGKRHVAKSCLDWSERRPHLGGVLGAALLDLMIDKHWVIRDLDSRALTVTARGQRALDAWLAQSD
ncbi:ArsR/SmtB family transcription factor [Pararobbsia silviterrae]|uniref:Transcriptional regulator n=1 Tax=Pararobbsia silviterrae TaxID=1792498 RepID=A0A494XMP8_9BURK|nr:helix-turn-helix transcriptional regulator [Pararobbsia silviterrae]RKP51960.1 transcriptional regulator [Pararobbsia silviterrae]